MAQQASSRASLGCRARRRVPTNTCVKTTESIDVIEIVEKTGKELTLGHPKVAGCMQDYSGVPRSMTSEEHSPPMTSRRTAARSPLSRFARSEESFFPETLHDAATSCGESTLHDAAARGDLGELRRLLALQPPTTTSSTSRARASCHYWSPLGQASLMPYPFCSTYPRMLM